MTILTRHVMKPPMFTGLIEDTGLIHSYSNNKLVLTSPFEAKTIMIGESIAVDGCCLTVVSKEKGFLSFDVSCETIDKTKMKTYKKGAKVNLERAMLPTTRLGGHMVSGHVDAVGEVGKVAKNKDSVTMTFKFKGQLAPYLIEKGSITVDGVSLTVCDLKSNSFNVYLIPHTWNLTNLHKRVVGDKVNLECDLVGKYVVKNLSVWNKK